MWITAGVAGEGAPNESGVVVNGDFRSFRSLYLPFQSSHLYTDLREA